VEIVADPDGHRDQAKYGGDRREHHRPEPGRTGLHGGGDHVHAPILQLPGVVQQHDRVVDHDAGQTDDPDAGHDDSEGHGVNEKTCEHANERENDGRHDDGRNGQRVELSDENEGDQQQRNHESTTQERLGLVLLFLLAGVADLIAER